MSVENGSLLTPHQHFREAFDNLLGIKMSVAPIQSNETSCGHFSTEMTSNDNQKLNT